MSGRAARVAYLSMDSLEGFYTYEELTRGPLAERGIDVETISWRAAGLDWSAFDLVVIRSTWDYQHDLPAFLRTLEGIAAATTLENELELCRWNVEKTYLRDLEERGVPIVPTRYGEGPLPVRELFGELGRDEIVVKPVVSANANLTFRLRRDDWGSLERALAEAFAGRAWMAQPFLEGVVAEGEVSTFHFAGEYSHAVLKTPAAGDFRVQEEHGGLIRAVEPEPGLRRAAEAALAAVPGAPLYARPDFVRDGECWRLMELELVEPSLYFSYDEGAPARFAEAVARRLG